MEAQGNVKTYVAGVDVGGTTVKLGLFPIGEKPVTIFEIPTPGKAEIGTLFDRIAAALRAKMDELGIPQDALKAAGIGLPGPVRDDGYVTSCVNLGMGPSFAGEALSKALGVPAAPINDANAAALGEVAFGAAAGAKNAVMVTLGTGVGGGIIVDGKVLAGLHGIGGEIGHFVVNPAETVKCNCGNAGCLEQYASATGIVRTAKRLLAESTLASVLREDKRITAKDVIDAAKAGDPIGVEALEVFGQYLGLAVAHLTLTTDPEKIILGGGVSKAGRILVDVLDKYVSKYTHIAEKRGEIVLATLGNDAGAYGAAALAESLLR